MRALCRAAAQPQHAAGARAQRPQLPQLALPLGARMQQARAQRGGHVPEVEPWLALAEAPAVVAAADAVHARAAVYCVTGAGPDAPAGAAPGRQPGAVDIASSQSSDPIRIHPRPLSANRVAATPHHIIHTASTWCPVRGRRTCTPRQHNTGGSYTTLRLLRRPRCTSVARGLTAQPSIYLPAKPMIARAEPHDAATCYQRTLFRPCLPALLTD